MWSNHPERTRNFPVTFFSLNHSGSIRFGVVEPHPTHSNHSELTQNLISNHAFSFITMVRGGSVQSNHPELTRTFPVVLFATSSQWFKEVQCGQTTPNSLDLPCSPTSPLITVVRGGSVWSNRPELTRTLRVGLITLSSQWFRFGVVEPPRTHSN